MSSICAPTKIIRVPTTASLGSSPSLAAIDTTPRWWVSADGTGVAGRVEGHGPPRILVHGAYGDGEIAWRALLPYFTDRYTCYLPSTRGHADLERFPGFRAE